MAITRAQQARQMYNKGSKKPVTQAGVKNFLGKQEMVTAPKFWLSEPDHVKAKLAYITDEEEKILIDKNLYGSLKGKPNKGPAGLPSLQGGDAGGLGGSGGSAAGDGGGPGERNGGGENRMPIAPQVTPPIINEPNRNKMPIWMQLGYSSQDEYDQATGSGGIKYRFMADGGIMSPGAVQPQQTLDLNKMAYRFMADGGFLEDTDEARQAYGLGSIVRKITRPIKKIVKKATKTVKKVAKSPIGRIALAVAAPYALGPAMASSAALSGLTAAQQAALISAATTGITQVASGEDLNFKDIALSAAIGGVSASAFPPGGRPGVDGKAFNAARTSAAPKFQLPRGGGADFSQIAASSTRPNMFDIAGPATKPSTFTQFTKDVLNPRGISQVAKDPSLFSSITQNLGKFGSKAKDLLIMNKDGTGVSPLKLAGLAGLAGLATAKGIEQEEAEEMDRGPGIDIAAIRRRPFDYFAPRFAGSEFDFYAAEGGQAKKEPVAKKVMPLLDMGGMEKDYRAEGGFVPIGRMEKADDVPARLSKNEFVFTADAVRNAGDGDVDKGAEVMYNMMKNLEAGGDVSEESQGLEGARRMFQTSQRLEEVL